ncbi:MAG: hypothetical protein RPU52_02465 [Candidatus Sedimenticola sp. (ex Thyasira tokunagai)]
MEVACPKCGHKRTERDDESTPKWQCPECGIAYGKVMPNQATSDQEKISKIKARASVLAAKKTNQSRKSLSAVHIIGMSFFGLLFIAVIFSSETQQADRAVNKIHSDNATIKQSKDIVKAALKGQVHQAPKITPIRVKPIVTDPSRLYSEYERNEVAADLRYKGKLVALKGKVRSIGKDIFDDIYVTLETTNKIMSIQCFFHDRDAETIADLNKGDYIHMEGTVTGKMGNVILKKCNLVQ